MLDRTKFNKQKRQFKELGVMGITDVAEALGWTPSKTRLYVDRGLLPGPVGEVGKRSVWLKIQIEPYMRREQENAAQRGADQSENERV